MFTMRGCVRVCVFLADTKQKSRKMQVHNLRHVCVYNCELFACVCVCVRARARIS